jgi:hypothetical protein
VGAGSLRDGFVAPFGGDAVATDGEFVEPGVGACSLVEGADVPGEAVTRDGEVEESGVGAGSFTEAEDAFGAGVDPLDEVAAAMAQPGVGAGSLSESVDVSADDVAGAGRLVISSAEASGIAESETKAAAPSAIAETRRMLSVMETSLFLMGRRDRPPAGENAHADRRFHRRGLNRPRARRVAGSIFPE